MTQTNQLVFIRVITVNFDDKYTNLRRLRGSEELSAAEQAASSVAIQERRRML